jgi:hypothetical protein
VDTSGAVTKSEVSCKSGGSSKEEVLKPKKEVMVVGELHKIVGDNTIANDLCDISVMTIVDIIEQKIDPTSSKILLVSEGKEANSDFSRIIDSLVRSSGFTKKNFANMIELSERTLELNPLLRNIVIVHSIILLLRDLDYYMLNRDDRMNTQFNMVIDINYFSFLISKMYQLHEIFDQDVMIHFSYIANMIVYSKEHLDKNLKVLRKQTKNPNMMFDYEKSFDVILNFIRDRFFDGVPPSVQAIITELVETKSIEQRLVKYDRFRTILREIRDNILVSRIEKNASNFDLIVIIFGCGHYENICRLIGEREELVLSPQSFNPSDPAHLLTLQQSILSSALGSSFTSI